MLLISPISPYLYSCLITQPPGGGPGSDQREPNIKDVVQFLHSDDYVLVSNAASYVQHLAYGDNNMKNKIR